MDEEWRQVEGWPDYQVSNLGRVRSARPWFKGHRPPRILKPWLSTTGYFVVGLCGPIGKSHIGVHRLVCIAFHGLPPSQDHEAAHWDGVKTNNLSTNLRWATGEENSADKKRHGTHLLGSQTNGAKLTETEVLTIRELAASGLSDKEIAEKFSVADSRIRMIRLGQQWKWLIGDLPKIEAKFSPRDGRPRTGKDHHASKLDAGKVLQIRAAENISYAKLAKQFGVSVNTIFGVKKNRIWKHVVNAVA